MFVLKWYSLFDDDIYAPDIVPYMAYKPDKSNIGKRQEITTLGTALNTRSKWIFLSGPLALIQTLFSRTLQRREGHFPCQRWGKGVATPKHSCSLWLSIFRTKAGEKNQSRLVVVFAVLLSSDEKTCFHPEEKCQPVWNIGCIMTNQMWCFSRFKALRNDAIVPVLLLKRLWVLYLSNCSLFCNPN